MFPLFRFIARILSRFFPKQFLVGRRIRSGIASFVIGIVTCVDTLENSCHLVVH